MADGCQGPDDGLDLAAARRKPAAPSIDAMVASHRWGQVVPGSRQHDRWPRVPQPRPNTHRSSVLWIPVNNENGTTTHPSVQPAGNLALTGHSHVDLLLERSPATTRPRRGECDAAVDMLDVSQRSPIVSRVSRARPVDPQVCERHTPETADRQRSPQACSDGETKMRQPSSSSSVRSAHPRTAGTRRAKSSDT